MLDESRLRIFLAVAQTGSFSRAARQFNITQPAVSQNIAELEKNFGIKLFVRGNGAVELTPEGRVFRNYAENICGKCTEAETIFSNFAELASLRSIGIAIDVQLLPWAGSLLLPYIYKVCPDIEVRILPYSRNAAADLRITQKEGVRLAEASPSFSSHALFRLVRALI